MLRLENEVLRCRIRELEQANEELLAMAGRAQKSAVVATDVAPKAAGTSGENSICPNCGREVPSSNLAAHMIHCERNFYRCVACGDVLPVRDKAEHLSRWTDRTWALSAARLLDLPTLRGMRAHGLALEDVACPETGETLLHVAAGQDSPELLSLLLSRGAPAAAWLAALAPGRGSEAALHTAAAGGHEAAAALLLESRADVHQRNGAGETPLLLACRVGAAQLVRRLVDAGADPGARTALGDTAMQVAQTNGHVECGLALGVRRRASEGEGGSAGMAVGMPPLRPGSKGRGATGLLCGSAPPTAGGCSGAPGRPPATPLSSH